MVDMKAMVAEGLEAMLADGLKLSIINNTDAATYIKQQIHGFEDADTDKNMRLMRLEKSSKTWLPCDVGLHSDALSILSGPHCRTYRLVAVDQQSGRVMRKEVHLCQHHLNELFNCGGIQIVQEYEYDRLLDSWFKPFGKQLAKITRNFFK